MAEDPLMLDPALDQLHAMVMSQRPQLADAIVWLQGNGYDRGGKVLELYRAGFAPRIVVTGNNVRIVGEDVVKVVDIVRWLHERGIHDAAIECDEQSMHTLDQACRIVAMAKKRNWMNMLLVGSPHHQLRAFLTFLKQAQIQQWAGRIVNQPASIEWDCVPSGLRKTLREAYNNEIAKITMYKNNVATIKEGLAYLVSYD